jgi:hypothetical protein
LRLLRPLFRDEESMAKRRFLSVLAVPAYGQLAGDEVAALPYSYTVG